MTENGHVPDPAKYVQGATRDVIGLLSFCWYFFMKITFVSKKYHPCTACKFIRKRCIRQNGDTEECVRCMKKGLKCVSDGDASDSSDVDLYVIEDGEKELQDWHNTVARLNSEMNTAKVDLEQSLIHAKRLASVEWRLTLVNGTLQLDTPIRTMDELFMFTQASVRYLSPFSGLFVKQPVRFQSTSISISLGLASEIQRKELLNPRRHRFGMLDYNKEFTKISASFDLRVVISGLVTLYLEHYIPFTGFLHPPTFLKYYNNLDDPMDSALTLAVCTDALFTLLYKIQYTPGEIRTLADMFYIRCRDLLFDMYDDPKQKLDVVLVTSLLQKYVADVRLNDLEANRLVSIALLVCADLAKCRDKMTPVEWVLFQRSYFRLKVSNLSYLIIHSDKFDITVPEAIEDMDVLDDEPEVTKDSIRMTNEMIRFIGSPYISFLLGKVTNIFSGKSCDILFEDIVRYEFAVKTCWSGLPAMYRICDDPFDSEGYKLVQGKIEPNYLFPFAVLHLVTGLIASSVLQPRVMPTLENSAVTEAIQVAKTRLRSLAAISCKVLVHALSDNWLPSSRHLPFFGMTATRYCLYCMEQLASCEDFEFPLDLLHLLKKRVHNKSKSIFPAGHYLTLSCSLLNNCRADPGYYGSVFEIYDQRYPLPGFAMISDIYVSSLNSIESRHLTAKDMSQSI